MEMRIQVGLHGDGLDSVWKARRLTLEPDASDDETSLVEPCQIMDALELALRCANVDVNPLDLRLNV